jgi:hypothetical protein
VESTTTAYIAGGSLFDGVLTVIGSCGGDLVTGRALFRRPHTTQGRFSRVSVAATGWTQSSAYPPNSITEIRMELGGGKDTATISEMIKSPAFIDAGAGDDIVTGRRRKRHHPRRRWPRRARRRRRRTTACRAALETTPFRAAAGNDRSLAAAGDDRLFAAGQDILFGEAGNDTLFGGTTCLDDPNADILVGGDGRDTLCGGDGRDLLVGGLGADNLQGDAGDDVVLGGFASMIQPTSPRSRRYLISAEERRALPVPIT